MAFHTVNILRRRTISQYPSLPHELLVKVFEELLLPELADYEITEQPKDLDEFLVGRRALVACSLVDRQWYYVATSILWRKPVFPSIKSLAGFLTALHPTIDPTNPNSLIRTPTSRLPSAYPVGCSGRASVRSFELQPASGILCAEPDLNLSKFVHDNHITALAQISFSSQDGENISCFPNLESLSLAGCHNVTDMPVIELIASHAPTLKSIVLSGCRHITDMTVQFIVNLCGSHLEELKLRNCGLVSDESVLDITAGCQALKRLDIGWCRRVSDRSLRALASMNLEELCISGCRAITMTGLVSFAASGSSNLSRFSFHSPAFPQSSQVQPAFQLTELFKVLPTTLRALSVHQASNLSECHVSLICERFPSLNALTLEGFRELSEDSFDAFAKLPLEELCLPSCRRVDDCCLRILANSPHASRLRVLDLSDCADVSDASLLRLAGVHHLYAIKALGSSSLNTAASFPKLHTLLLTNNRRVTVRGLVPAMRALRGLRFVDLSGTGEGIVEPFRPIRPYASPTASTFGFRQLLQLHAPPSQPNTPAPIVPNDDKALLSSKVGDALGNGSLETSTKKGVCVVRSWAECEKVRMWDVDISA